MRHRRPVSAAAAVLLIGVVTGPAAGRGTAAQTAQPAAGTATSALNLLTLALAGHEVRVGGIALTSDTVSGNPVAKVVVTPLTVDGAAYGEQTVTPANSPTTVPVVDSTAAVPAALTGLAAVRSPVFDVSATDSDGASSKVGAASLGSVSVLGIPLKLDGSVNLASVVDTTSALGEKTLTVKNFALPSVADLLAALGLDLPKLPVDTLSELVEDLDLTSTALTAAQKALDDASVSLDGKINDAQSAVDDAAAALAASELADAQSQLAAAEADLAQKTAALQPLKAAVTAAQTNVNSKNGDLTTANANLASATAAVDALVTVLLPFDAVLAANPSLAQTYNAAVAARSAAQAAAASATGVLTTATNNLAAAQSAVDVAQAAVNALKGTIATLQAAADALQKTLTDLINALNALTARVQPQIDALLVAITAVLDATPLVSIDSISVQTQALAKSAVAGGQIAKVVGGEVVGLKVLGTDVLNTLLGTSRIDLLDLSGGTLSAVSGVINGLNGTLSAILSNVPSLPALSIPAPKVELLTQSASTDIAGGFGIAQNSVRALQVTIPAVTIPAAVALPNAASLPGISGLPSSAPSGAAARRLVGAVNAAGDLVSQPITFSAGTLSEQSKFRPAVVAAPGTTSPGSTPTGSTPTGSTPTGSTPTGSTPENRQLPTTGLPVGIALAAILLVGSGLVMRRRLAGRPQA